MAAYSELSEGLEYFDADQSYEKTMTITHWMKLPNVTPE